MLAHFQIPGFEFGFIGVDIFFVISGFLITRVLYKDFIFSDLEQPKNAYLSLSTFYLRRIRRLLPAAVVVIMLVNIISYFLYNSQSRDVLIGNSKWALVFLANVSFLRSESDYFQQNSEPSMLQHYWSLSVEEQFYFIWPLLFLIAASFHKIRFRDKYFRFNKRILALILSVTIMSYLFLQFGFDFAPTEVYFSIFTRAWELGVGAFFGVLAFHKRKELQFSRFELFTPLIASYVFSSHFITDNNWARLIVVPVIATGFFLYAGQDQNKPASRKKNTLDLLRRTYLFFGDISYSLYLVHWPIFIVASHLDLIDGLIARILLLPVSIGAGFLLWKFIEIPFQKISLPKSSKWEGPAFAFVKERKPLIGLLAFSLVGSLYLVTYPSVKDRLLYSDSNLKAFADDPNLRMFAEYKADNLKNLKNDSGILSEKTESISAQTDQILTELLQQQEIELRLALKATEVPIDLREKLATVAKDVSVFERTPCATEDSAIPRNCVSPGKDGEMKSVGLIGDSKMAALAQPLIDYFKGIGWRVEPMIMTGCTPSFPVNKFQRNCIARIDWMKEHVAKTKFDVLILAEYPTYLPTEKEFRFREELFKVLKLNTNRLIVMEQIHQIPDPRKCIKEDFTYTQSCSQLVKGELQNLSNFLQFYRSLLDSKTIIVDTKKWYMVDDLVPLIVKNVFLFRDGVHLTNSFNKSIQPLIKATLDSVLSQ